MFPKINPKQMQKMMQSMGIKQEEFDAEEVIIKTAEGDVIISNPEVLKVDMGGKATFQISGDIDLKEKEKFTAEDVQTVVSQTGKSEEEVKKKLEENDGDLAKSILELS